jgi:CRP-like cAMP-binding protein
MSPRRARSSVRSSWPRGRCFRPGEPAPRIGFIARGVLRFTVTDSDGRERILDFRAEDQLACAYSASVTGGPSAVSIEAVEPTWLMAISQRAFLRLLEERPAWRLATTRWAEERAIRHERRIRSLLLDDAATRYRRFLAEYPELARRLGQGQIAAYLGVTPETMSRIRGKLT